jgi:hypothetical protein
VHMYVAELKASLDRATIRTQVFVEGYSLGYFFSND